MGRDCTVERVEANLIQYLQHQKQLNTDKTAKSTSIEWMCHPGYIATDGKYQA